MNETLPQVQVFEKPSEVLKAGFVSLTCPFEVGEATAEARRLCDAGTSAGVLLTGEAMAEVVRTKRGFQIAEGGGCVVQSRGIENGGIYISVRSDVRNRFVQWCKEHGYTYALGRVKGRLVMDEVLKRKWKRKKGVPIPELPPDEGRDKKRGWRNVILSPEAVEMIDAAVMQGLYKSRTHFINDFASNNFERREAA
jgi:hypothetical protein